LTSTVAVFLADGPVRATPRDSLYHFSLLGIEILMKKYPPTAFPSGYPNVAILHSVFIASQR
jgi:hypothetical protein